MFRVSVKTFSRSKGASAVQRAAYRAGLKLYDYRTGELFDYSFRKDVIRSEIYLPKQTDPIFLFPMNLWNAAEKSEKRKDAVVAREILISLPKDLTDDQRWKATDLFAKFLVKVYGVAVQVSHHAPKLFTTAELKKLKGQHAVETNPGSGIYSNENFHAHVQMSTRRVNELGFGEKTRELDDRFDRGPKEIERIRQAAASFVNFVCASSHVNFHAEYQSYKRRGIKKEPQIFLGQAGFWAHRHGYEVSAGEVNDSIVALRKVDLKAECLEVLRKFSASTAENSAESEEKPTATFVEKPDESVQVGNKLRFIEAQAGLNHVKSRVISNKKVDKNSGNSGPCF